MRKKSWLFDPCHQCEEHGSDVEILTNCIQSGDYQIEAYDGDECRCDQGCKGWMTADDEIFYCNWDDNNPGGEIDAPEEDL